MTTTLNSIVTTIQIRRGAKLPLSISYDYTGLGIWTMPQAKLLQSLIDPAIKQWWDSLTSSQKSVLPEQAMSLKISVSCP